MSYAGELQYPDSRHLAAGTQAQSTVRKIDVVGTEARDLQSYISGQAPPPRNGTMAFGSATHLAFFFFERGPDRLVSLSRGHMYLSNHRSMQ
jgi:hypothetical protein